MKLFCLPIILLSFFPSHPCWGLDEGIVVEFEPEKEIDEGDSYLGVDRVLRSPVLAAGLEQGAVSLNRSIKGLMEAMFYNLMDQEAFFQLTDASQFRLGFERELFESNDGAQGTYVVVDKFNLGPRYYTPVTTVMGLPIYFGGDGQLNVLDIYLRTDGDRFVDTDELPYWRVLANNWLGLLPFLTAILPPSFNPNEMYDPVGELETPFIFPASVESAMAMKVGTVRSYSVSAVIHLGFNLLQKHPTYDLRRVDQPIDLTLPYKIYKEGSHRINVLRKEGPIFWIGLTNLDRIGHQVEGSAGKLYYVFSKALPAWYNWSGIPATLLPLNFSGSDAKVFQYDRLYEFDLRSEEAMKAFEKGVIGDFSSADQLAKEDMSGVKFHFTRYSNGDEKSAFAERSLFVQKSSRRDISSNREIKTEEPEGDFYILEAKAQIEDENEDVLVGAEKMSWENRAYLRVKKLKGEYRFDEDAENQSGLVFGLRIYDPFVDAMEFKEYLSTLQAYSGLSMASLPAIPVRDRERELRYRLDHFATAPLDHIRVMSVTPLHLGKLTVNSLLHFSSDQIDLLRGADEIDLLKHLCQAFGVGAENAQMFLDDVSPSVLAGKALGYIFAPISLLNIRFSEIDFVSEIAERLRTFRKVKKASKPLELISALREFIETKYPIELVSALLKLIPSEVARSVTFYTKPKGKSSKEIKDLFASINGRIIQSSAVSIKKERYEFIRSKLAHFQPSLLREWRSRPILSSLKLNLEEERAGKDKALALELKVANGAQYQKLSVFLRFVQGGKVDVGRFVLFEGMLSPFEQSEIRRGKEVDKLLRFYLSGSKSSISSFILDRAMELGGDFSIFLSVTEGEGLWSHERQIDFRYIDDKLLKPQKLN